MPELPQLRKLVDTDQEVNITTKDKIMLFGFGNKDNAQGKPVQPDPSELKERLEAALNEAHASLLKSGDFEKSAEVIAILIEAGAHLGAPHWMVSTQRIIGIGDWRQHYQEGLQLVSQACELMAEQQVGVRGMREVLESDNI